MNASILLQDSLLMIWNNRNSAERLSLMEKIYAPDIHFYESNDSEPFVGIESINNLIGKLQQEWAPDFEFVVTESPKFNHNVQHISWKLGAPELTVAIGSDIAFIEDDKIKSLYLFLNS
ncbi:hypothetical protein [Chryseobacterium cheonjiense]|nr:hypothetical protein [Chryseobacterium cheonjiense]